VCRDPRSGGEDGKIGSKIERILRFKGHPLLLRSLRDFCEKNVVSSSWMRLPGRREVLRLQRLEPRLPGKGVQLLPSKFGERHSWRMAAQAVEFGVNFVVKDPIAASRTRSRLAQPLKLRFSTGSAFCGTAGDA